MKNAINEILPGFGTQQWQRDFEALEDLEKVKEIAHVAMLDVVGLWQQYRALEAELAALKDPIDWTYIKAGRPETLPKTSRLLLLSCDYPGERAWPIACMGYWDNFVFTNKDNEPLELSGLRVYAWQPWPAPAPYPGGE